MTTEPIGIYVHIPFCKSKCAYCDFVSFGGALEMYEERYVASLVREIYEYRRQEKIKADTVFFGGGTPSVISAKSFIKITDALRDVFEISPSAEFTIEANPKTITEEKLISYNNAGVNRISLGLQSVNEKELKTLGRIHNFDDFVCSYNLCRSYGVSNINVDLMYGIPYQTKESFAHTLTKIVDLSPEHISAYGLILEEGTRLYCEKDYLPFPSEDEECDMYYMAAEFLRESGYSHYEISNYAKKGFRCAHNLKYWNDEEYIGFGLAAHSYFGKKRYANPVEFSEYFSPEWKEYRQIDEICDKDNAYEYAMMHLRLADGFLLSDYERRFKKTFANDKRPFIEELIKNGYMQITDGRISLTEKGFYVSNSILSEIL